MLVSEELVFQCIMPAVREGKTALPLTVELEHSEADDVSTLRAAWGGGRFNPLEAGDELSNQIIRSIVRDECYDYTNQNELRLTL